jgi:hypothetical protein
MTADKPRLAALGSLPTRNALDAMHDDRGNKRPTRIYTPAPDALRRPPIVYYPEHERESFRDGLAPKRWPRRTFVNPPYNKLQPWLDRFRASSEVVALIPVRTHRKWYRATLEDCDAVAFLNPIKFAGYAQTFPAPMSALYRGLHAFRFKRAFGDLGSVHVGPIG